MLWLWTSKHRLMLLAWFWWWYTPCAQEEKQSGKPPIQPDHDDAAIFAPAESCSAGLHINCYASICSNTYLLPLLTFEAETPLSAMLFWMVSRSRWSRILNENFPWALTGAPLIQSELVSTSPAKFLTNIAIWVKLLQLKSCSPDILTLAWILVR